MTFFKEKLLNICSRIVYLLSQFEHINVKKLSELPIRIRYIAVGENKVLSYLNKTISSVTELDFSSITTIGYRAFYFCTSLREVTIPDSVTTIGAYAFDSCKSLTKITIPDSVTSVGSEAFYNCTSLSEVTMGDSVTTIGDYVFLNCDTLTNIYFKSTTPPTIDSRLFSNRTTIHVPIGSGDAYKSATNWSSYASQIVENPNL